MSGNIDNLEVEEPKYNTILWAMSLADLLSIMLSFFVLLFAYSQIHETKAKSTVKGVQGAFSQKTEQAGIKDDIMLEENQPSENATNRSTVGADQPLRLYYASIKKVAKDLLAIDETNIIEKGDIMIIRLPTYMMFNANTAELEDKKLFLDMLADQLTRTVLNHNIDIEFMVGSQSDTNKGSASVLAVARAGAFARKMVSLGVNESSIYVGITETDPNFFTITFTPRDEPQAPAVF